MLSSVLGSERAVAVNIEIMRAFVRLRRLLADHEELAGRLDELDRRTEARFRQLLVILDQFAAPDVGEARRIGFRGDEKG